MLVAVFAAGVLGLSLPSPLHWLKPHTGQPSRAAQQRKADKVRGHHYSLHGWEMRIQKDGFTGRARCRLYKLKTLSQGRISYAQETFGFEMGPDVDVLNAWFRIDDQAARPWQTVYPELAVRQITPEGAGLENPTEGVVLIPLDDLVGARTVSIRVKESDKVHVFSLAGFNDALSAATANGCQSDSFERLPW